METMETNHHNLLRSIHRFAIDCSGRPGSLYDGYQDCILGRLNVRDIEQSYQLINTSKCQIIEGNTMIEKSNLLQLFGVEEELQLSIYLNLTSKVGLTSLTDYYSSIDKFTCILHFHHVDGEEHLCNHISQFQTSRPSFHSQTNATHIITNVKCGFYVMVILQLPSEEEMRQKLNVMLRKISHILESNCHEQTLEIDDEHLLNTISVIKIHSNNPELTMMTKLTDIFNYIFMSKSSTLTYPIAYTLQPIATIECSNILFSLPSDTQNLILRYVLQISDKIIRIKASLNKILWESFGDYRKQLFYDAHYQLSISDNEYFKKIKQLSNLLIDHRHGQNNISKINEALEDTYHVKLTHMLKDTTENLLDLEEKVRFINGLPNIRYCNVLECRIDENDNVESMERKLIADKQYDRILCSSDHINRNNKERLKQFSSTLLQEYETNPTLRAIYADFSYTKYPLNEMIMLSPCKTDNNGSELKHKNMLSSIVVEVPYSPPDPINILLLGETGVGKSTFINALVNYLTFDSLQAAELAKPIILIPVSFLLTSGDQFNECTVQLEGNYSNEDEHFNSFGQSVTQHCRSYIIELKNHQGQKLRLIDTPGFCDTRGSQQDDWNMKCILEYINNLTYLNAICFLLKPNTSRLKVFFRLCITEILNHLGPDSTHNIIFCFTNTRATFYTPGDTSPILKSVLTSLKPNNITMKKENTFCFDSESFRYLAALKKKFSFNDSDKNEYEKSWKMSSKECHRLIDYLSQDCQSYPIDTKQQAMKNIQFEIMHTIRPLLETIRNILRNILLSLSNSSQNFIELRVKSLHRLAIHCKSCCFEPILIGQFWIPTYPNHEMQKKCNTCSCTIEQHTPIEYILEHHSSTEKFDFDELNGVLLLLFSATVDFAYFLVNVICSIKDDPFLIGLNRMIAEEKKICENMKQNEFNTQLIQQLELILDGHQQQMSEMNIQLTDDYFSAIKDQIKMINEHRLLHDQIAAIKQHQQQSMHVYEYTC